MTAIQPPLYLGSPVSHPVDGFRRGVKNVTPIAGVIGSGDLAVTQNGTPNMSVNVAAGSAIIAGTEAPTTQGSYAALNDATVNLSIAASDPTNPRRDLVVAKVRDADYSGASRDWSLAVVTGTPAGSPADPAAPANSITLARIAVAANATTIGNANITDLRPYAQTLGRSSSPSGSRYASPRKGDLNVDNDFPAAGSPLQTWDGSAWRPIDNLRMFGQANAGNGSPPSPSTGTFLVQMDSPVVTLASNQAAVTFPNAFPNGVIGIIPTDGDDAVAKTFSVVRTSIAKTGFTVGSSSASGAVRVSYIAIGF